MWQALKAFGFLILFSVPCGAAQITINIPNQIANDVVDALGRRWNYTGDPTDKNAELAFVKKMLIQYLRTNYDDQKDIEAGNAAFQNQDNNQKNNPPIN